MYIIPLPSTLYNLTNNGVFKLKQNRQCATCATYTLNWLVFITEMKSVYCEVRTGSLNKAVCCIYLRTNSDLCHLQHKLIGFYNRDEKCLLRGTNWVFKYSILRFVFKWLTEMRPSRLCGVARSPSALFCYHTEFHAKAAVQHNTVGVQSCLCESILIEAYLPQLAWLEDCRHECGIP